MDVADPALYEAHTFHPLFKELRANDPVHWNPTTDSYQPTNGILHMKRGFHILTRYEDVLAASRNTAVFSSYAGGPTTGLHLL